MQDHLNLGGIKLWAHEDRPREKFLLKGKHTLSDAELMAILIGSGTKDESAVDLSRKILLAAGNDLFNLGKFTANDFKKFKGIGIAKALTLASALELGRRRKFSEKQESVKIRCSTDAYEAMRHKFTDLQHEEFHIVYLNRSNQIIMAEMLSAGGTKGTVVDVKMIMKSALEKLASSLILFHNHPSGNSQPSNEDIIVTKKIVEAAKYFDITVADHLIIFDSGYTSFADEGLM